ncbi:MAG: ATP phosphoribosyltransferase regulatory subunit [Clostridia bacterium]|nr:ATP phosphoribosyltransferase regulatory subunit [Clostridia bacterium]
MKIRDTVLKPEEEAIFRLRELYGKYGYTQYKMSKFEEYDLYVRNKSFLVSDSVITFTDTNGKLMALKPDVTLSIVKNTKDLQGQVQKLYYNENVYRISGKSRTFREIMQLGLECIGDIDGYCIGEVLMLACGSLAAISENYILDVSHLGLLSAILDRIPVSPTGRKQLLESLAHKSLHDADTVCREEGVPAEQAELLKRLAACSGNATDALQKLYALLPDASWQEAVKGFEAILSVLPCENIRVDFSVVNDMRYYSGIVFQGFVEGVPESILSGGQYDHLMRRMDKKSGAIGFAVYLDQLEGLGSAKKEYDVDTVILYDESVCAGEVHRVAREMTASGTGVKVLKALPERLKYRRLVTIKESGVEILETNA